MAPNGPAGPVAECPLIGSNRKWLAEGQTGANDPKQTSDLDLAWPALHNLAFAVEDIMKTAIIAIGLGLALSSAAFAQQRSG